MIYFDVTKTGRAAHHSGLMRVSSRLREELTRARPGGVQAVEWRDGAWRELPSGRGIVATAQDWILTPELFSPVERPGLAEVREQTPARWAAIYYDAIPLKFPHTTWPQSVARHPGHLKFLADCDRVLAISEASRAELEAYWAWSEPPRRATVTTIPLGADRGGESRVTNRVSPAGSTELLMVGIIEPRKNQTLLLDVAERLHARGVAATFHFVGRVNPHFGEPIVARLRSLARHGAGVKFHGVLDDAAMRGLEARCRAALFPSRAEGNGLPVLEALWRGLPCLCSDLAPLLENARGGGCVVLPGDDVEAWTARISELLADDRAVDALGQEAALRALPTWTDSAEAVLAELSR